MKRTDGVDLIAITETWLQPEHQVPSQLVQGYVAYRQDRTDGRKGGGVLLLVKTNLNQGEGKALLVTPNVQVTSTQIRGGRPLGVLCVYRAPLAVAWEDEELMRVFHVFTGVNRRFIIVGDLNVPEISWEHENSPEGTVGCILLDWLHLNAFTQHIKLPTRFRGEQTASTLDLVITRYANDIRSVEVEGPLCKSDHVVLKLIMPIVTQRSARQQIRNFNRVNVEKLLEAAREVDWIPVGEQPTLEERWKSIKDGLYKLTTELVPLKQRRSRNRPIWWKPKIDRALKNRSKYWKIYWGTRTLSAWEAYKRARNSAQSIQRRAQYEYEVELARLVKLNPKRFYAYVQSKKNIRESIGTIESSNGSIAESDQEKADALMEFFKSVHRRPNKASLDDRAVDQGTLKMEGFDISEDDVFRELSALNKHKAAGPDGLHPAVIQPLAGILTRPVAYLYQTSLTERRLPQDWKTAVVVAIHKSGSRNKATNYRPVSLTSVLCKCLERIIRGRICQHLAENSLLNPAQHGFVKQRSCLTNLLSFLDEVTGRLDAGMKVEVCYLDFSKAFDSVCHELLLRKLEGFGIAGDVKEWIAQFLKRDFCVKVGNSISAPAVITSGVPQGSVLGPLLFLLFVNDLTDSLRNPAFMFADDVKIAGINLEYDIQVVKKWSKKWDLPLNQEKCQILGLTEELGEGEPRSYRMASEVKDLGVVITNDFKVARQCEFVANKARRELFRVRTAISCRKPDIFLPLYKTIVRPHLEYCVQAWSPYMRKDIEHLEKVQKLATRMIEGQKGKPYDQRLRDLNLFSLERRRIRGDLIETFKIVKGLSGIKFETLFSFLPDNRTRGHCLRLQRNHSKGGIRTNFFSNRVIPLWNKLPEEVI
ncbi:MAG: reverse transcriptase domain-containing protein, partial [Paraclostridium sp.]|uniref:reverse transcriptase domain-containing protein n=1 Tax=Paraclostridium sp. TaxID=2023273 RepID=UPI003F384D92